MVLISSSRLRTCGRRRTGTSDRASLSIAEQPCPTSTRGVRLWRMICASLVAGFVGSTGRKAPPARCIAIIAARKWTPRSASRITTTSGPTPSLASREAIAEAPTLRAPDS